MCFIDGSEQWGNLVLTALDFVLGGGFATKNERSITSGLSSLDIEEVLGVVLSVFNLFPVFH
jgi:hypothetical protein